MGSITPLAARPSYAPPTPITASHRFETFACGKLPLDEWLKAHALDNEGKASRTYVVTALTGDDAGAVVAYYTLAYGSVAREDVPRKIRHGLPNPVPIMVLARLAVDARHSGKGLGPSLLREAMQRSLEASRIAGMRALLVHALDDEAVSFYAKFGFQLFPSASRTLLLPIETIRSSLAA